MANFHVYVGQDGIEALPVVRKIGARDLREALRLGAEDFWAMPSHLAFLGLVYPLCGLVLAYATSQQNALQLVFPLASGFALLGPIAAVGLYEMSRRRELGLDTSWKYAFNVARSPSIPSIGALGLLLLAIFLAWIAVAQLLYVKLFGSTPPASYPDFLGQVVSTQRGWTLIVAGCLIGFGFAVVSLSISVVSFPLLLDRDIGAAAAVATSVKTVRENPATMALWGFIVAGGAGDRLAPAVHRPRRRHADPRTRHLASLPHRGRARPRARASDGMAEDADRKIAGRPRLPAFFPVPLAEDVANAPRAPDKGARDCCLAAARIDHLWPGAR